MDLELKKKSLTGIQIFDQHHAHLNELINDLEHAISYGKDSKKTEEALEALADYSIVHLDAEEMAMKQHDYPEYESHKAKHMEMRNKIDGYHESHAKEGAVPNEDLFLFLAHWWEEHIMKVDKLYGSFFQAKGLK